MKNIIKYKNNNYFTSLLLILVNSVDYNNVLVVKIFYNLEYNTMTMIH